MGCNTLFQVHGWQRRPNTIGKKERPKIQVASGPIRRVLYKRIREGKQRIDKFESEDDGGVWLGHTRSSHEVLIGTRERVVRAYSFRRRDDGARWNFDLIKGMRGTLDQPDPSRPGSRIPIRVNSDDRIIVDDASCAPGTSRRLRIKHNFLEKYGYTDGCAGCRYKRSRFVGSRDHTQACRDRIYTKILTDESAFGEQLKERLRCEAGRVGERTTEIRSEGVAEDAGSFVTGPGNSCGCVSQRGVKYCSIKMWTLTWKRLMSSANLIGRKTRPPWCFRKCEHALWPTVEQQQAISLSDAAISPLISRQSLAEQKGMRHSTENSQESIVSPI